MMKLIGISYQRGILIQILANRNSLRQMQLLRVVSISLKPLPNFN